MFHEYRVRGSRRLPARAGRPRAGGPNGDPWFRGIVWGPLSPFTDEESLIAEIKRDPWSVSLLRRIVEDEAECLGLDVNGLFRLRRVDVRAIVQRLASTGVLTLEDCRAVAMLLLILTCRDRELPEAGRRHAMSLLSTSILRERHDPRSPTAAETVGATWTALRSLGAAAVIDLGTWMPGDVVFDGEYVERVDYKPVVMAPGIRARGGGVP